MNTTGASTTNPKTVARVPHLQEQRTIDIESKCLNPSASFTAFWSCPRFLPDVKAQICYPLSVYCIPLEQIEYASCLLASKLFTNGYSSLTMATPADETTQSTPDFSDDNFDFSSLNRSADYLRDEIKRLETRLSSHQSINHLIPALIRFETTFQETTADAQRTEMEDYQREAFRKIWRRAERLGKRLGRLIRRARARARARARRGSALVEGLLACEDLKREVFGDLFCREFEELRMGMRGGGDERRRKNDGKEEKEE